MAGTISRRSSALLTSLAAVAVIAGCGGSDDVELPALADSVAEEWYVDEQGESGSGGVVDPPPAAAYCQSEEICKVKARPEGTISLHVDLAEDGCWEAVSVVIGGGGEPIDAPFEGCVEEDADVEGGLFSPAESERCPADDAEAAASCLEYVAES